MKTRGEKAETKKGAALILTLAVTSLLIVLAVSIMTAAFTNQIGTFGMDRSSQLKLLAQTGMEKSISILREKIVQRVLADGYSNSILYTIARSPKTETMHLLDLDPQTDLPDTSTGEKYSIYFNIYNNDSFSLDSGSQTASTRNEGDCYVTFTDGDPSDSEENIYEDSSDGIKKDCIKIRLLAYGRGESKRTETVYIDKNSISDYYLDKLFQNTLSALGEPGTAGEEPIQSFASFPEIQRPGKIKISGDIYLQGERLDLESDQNIEINGSVKVLASQDANEVNFNKNLRFYDYDKEDNKIVTNTNLDFPTDLKRAFSIKGGFDGIPKTPIVENSRLRNVAPLGIAGSGKTVDVILSEPETGFPLVKGSSDDYAMVSAKCIQNGSRPVDFSKLVLGRDLDSHTGLRRFLATRPDLNLEGGSYKNESDYIKLFKVILVDGDLLIDASKFYYDQITDNNYDQITDDSSGLISDFRKMRMMNYIIIASGTVKIKGAVEMYSSSIMAKDIIFESGTLDMPVTDETLENGTPTGNQIYHAADSYVANVLDQLNNLQLDRILVGETEHATEIDPETGMEYPADPLKDVIDPAMNFTNSTLASDGVNLADAYAAAKRMKVQTTISLSGIGSDDSVKEISADMGEYGETWADARGYVTNTQKALINEYLIKNLSADYAKQLKLKIISWEER